MGKNMSGENTLDQARRKAIPNWLLTNEAARVDPRGGLNSGFFMKTIRAVNDFVQEELAAERQAVRKGLMQSLDPRVKLGSILLYIVLAGVLQGYLPLLLLAAAAVLLVWQSGLHVRDYISRVWLMVPLLLMVMSLPAATNLLIPGKPLLYIYSLGNPFLPGELYISLEGVQAVFRLVLRTGISLSFGYLLVMTTRWGHLMKALQMLKVPGMMVALLDTTYRYLFLLCRTAVEMFEARVLRTVGRLTGSTGRNLVASGIALLLVKTLHTSEEVYHAMVGRGYDGDMVTLEEFHISKADWLWMTNVGFIALMIIMGELVFG
jgi:cobalt/nickel transport system permease protein